MEPTVVTTTSHLQRLEQELKDVRAKEKELMNAIYILKNPRCPPAEYIAEWLDEAYSHKGIDQDQLDRLSQWCVANINVEQLVVHQGSYCYEGTRYDTYQTTWMKERDIGYESSEHGGEWLCHAKAKEFSSLGELVGHYTPIKKLAESGVFALEQVMTTIHCEALKGGWSVCNEGYIIISQHECVD